MSAKGTYTPLNDLDQPWLAGQLTMEDGIIVPVFYVGDNGHAFFGKYNGKVSFFNHALKELIKKLTKGVKDGCFKIGDVCVNGFPLFVRQNTGKEYISKDDDIISLVAKRNGANDGDYTVTNLDVDDKRSRVIPIIKDVRVLKDNPVDKDEPEYEDKPVISITTKIGASMKTFGLDYPYYNTFHARHGYKELQIMLKDSCSHDDLCGMFNERREILEQDKLAKEKLAKEKLARIQSYPYQRYMSQPEKHAGGTRRKKKTKRAKRSKRTRRH